jgi:hypothetical protein
MFGPRAAVLAAAVLAMATPTFAADDGFGAFWASFKTAAAKNDKAALSGMVGPTLQPFSQFYSRYLTAKTRHCLATGKPVHNVDATLGNTYYVVCDSTAYVFMLVKGAWKLDDQELD